MKKLLAVLLLFGMVAFVHAEDELEPGLVGEYFEFGEELDNYPDVANKKPKVKRVDKTVNFDAGDGEFEGTGLSEQFFARWTGIIKIEKDGKYKFITNSDDGSRLFIDGKEVVDNGGLHAAEEKEGEVELKAGNHEIKIEFFENGGQAVCQVSWEPAGGAREVVPEKVLFHKKGADKQ